MSEQHEETRSSGELLKFMALVVILLGAVGIVSSTRPLIFGVIVPAVMGEGIDLPTAEPVDTPAEEDAVEAPDGEEEAVDGETADSDTTDNEEVNEAETAYPGNNNAAAEDAPTDAKAPEVVIHTIKQGETLQTIAAQYGITLQQLIAANKLANPNYIRVGDQLTIPQAEE